MADETVKNINLYGRLFIRGTIKAETGLHIGGSESEISIGGVDNTVVRDPLSQQPYIPGSSLKGKMRSLMEKLDRRPQNKSIGRDVTMHVCQSGAEYAECDVCKIYGVTGDSTFSWPTRLVVRDTPLTAESVTALEAARTDLPFTEVKWEVAIDRVTSAAVPRQLERVPAGAEFGPFELVFSLYKEEDKALFERVLEGMSLLEDDYLGGSGSRGSGKIAFTKLEVISKRSGNYLTPETITTGETLADLLANRTAVAEELNAMFTPAE